MYKTGYVALFTLILLHTLLFSATISGNIYEANHMQLLKNTVVTVEQNNNTLSQKVYTNNYSLTLETGKYILRAYNYENGSLKYYVVYNLDIKKENANLDLLLIPYELYKLTPDFVPSPLTNGNGMSIPNKNNNMSLLLPVIAFLILVVIGSYFLFMNANSIAKKEDKEKKERIIDDNLGDTKQTRHNKYGNDNLDNPDVDNDELKILSILKENDGRMRQKDVREILNFSESKMSLIITELEVSGYIKRIKKGRTNILKLKNLPKNMNLPKIKR